MFAALGNQVLVLLLGPQPLFLAPQACSSLHGPAHRDPAACCQRGKWNQILPAGDRPGATGTPASQQTPSVATLAMTQTMTFNLQLLSSKFRQGLKEMSWLWVQNNSRIVPPATPGGTSRHGVNTHTLIQKDGQRISVGMAPWCTPVILEPYFETNVGH